MWNCMVLGLPAVFEGSSFTLALRQFLKQKGRTPLWEALHRGKDPTGYTVLAEDVAALVGLLVAGLGIGLSHALNMPELGGVASLLIGLLLAGVEVTLIRESRGLLIGQGIRPGALAVPDDQAPLHRIWRRACSGALEPPRRDASPRGGDAPPDLTEWIRPHRVEPT